MILPIIQVLATALMLAYAGYWRHHHSRRRSETWDQIVMRLRPNDWGIENVTERYLYSQAITATPDNIWNGIQGPRGLWAMYCNASVFVQLADYAAEHGDRENIPQSLLESIRSDAFHIRVSVLMALGQYILSHSSVAAKVNAHRATASYTAMVARLTELFQDHSALLFPKYLEAAV